MQPDPRTAAGWQRPPEPPVTAWWFLVPLLTCGLGAAPMVLAGAVKLRSQLHGLLAGGYFAVLLVLCGTSALADGGADGPEALASALISTVYFIMWIVGTIHVAFLGARVRAEFLHHRPQPRVYGRATPRTGRASYPNRAQQPPALTHYPPPPPPWHSPGVDPALARAQWRAGRREEARKLQAAQPSLAAELMIGRPDMPGRQYDDGGLVDVNHVPAEHLARHLHIDRDLADRIVAARDLHEMTAPDELIIYCEGLTEAKLDTFRDRLVFIPR